MRKRSIFMLLATCIISILYIAAPTKASAATEQYYTYYTYTVSDGQATIKSVKQTIAGDQVIPSTLGGYPVVSIGRYAFRDCDKLTGITIPDSVTIIDERAFHNCKALTSITIPRSVTTIGEYAFYNCRGFTNFTIPSGVVTISNGAFYYCTGLTNITIHDSVTTIGAHAFYGCTGLTGITIPDSVISIGDFAFYYCINIKSITLPDSVTTIGEQTFESCKGLESITLPYSIITIGNGAFTSCTSLTSITIPDSITAISDYMFLNCISLTDVIIPKSITSIGEHAFFGCKSLEEITLPDSVKTIGEQVFYNCTALKSIAIPKGVTTIALYTFNNCSSLTRVTLPNSIITIDDRAFHNCSSLENITIPNGVISIGKRAFYGCDNLKSITIPDSVTTIDSEAFDSSYDLTDIYYSGSEEDWGNISISWGNSVLTEATIHFNGGVAEDIPGVDIETPEADEEYLPTDINNVVINGQGTVFGRFKIYNTDGTVAKNKTVGYIVDSGSNFYAKTNEYGYVSIKIPNIKKSKDYVIKFSGKGIKSSTGVLSVTVEPLHFETKYDGTITRGATVGVGIGVGGSIGDLEAEAKVANIGASGSTSKGLSFTHEFADNKDKISLTTEMNYDIAAEAKAGLFANAGVKNIAGVKVSAIDVNANASYGNVIGMGYEDDDFNFDDADDVQNLSLFMLAVMLEGLDSNVASRYILKMLDVPVNSYTKGSAASLGAGASLGVIEAEIGEDEGAEVTLAGVDGSSVWSNLTTTFSDNSKTYSSKLLAEAGTKLFNANISVSDVTVFDDALFEKDFINNSFEFEATKNADGQLEELAVLTEESKNSSIFWNQKSETDIIKISYSDEAAQDIADSNKELGKFANGKKGYFSLGQSNKAVKAMLDNDHTGVYSESKAYEEGVDINFSASAQVIVELGGEIGVSGISGYEYETLSGIYENGTVYIQAQNDIDELVADKALTFSNIERRIKETISGMLKELWTTISGYIDNAADAVIEAGKAVVQKTKDTLTGWKVSITTAIENIGIMTVLSVEDEISLFSTASLATTIGDPYIISVADENGNSITDFSANPLMLSLSYTEQQLADAGVSDVSEIAILRWDDEKCVYVKMGGTLDRANSCVNLEILEPGQYILAVDNCSPAITAFKSSDSGKNPVISAVVSDMSGIGEFVFSIDDTSVVTNENLSSYYDFTTGKFKYATSKLSEGTHNASIFASDTFGNEIEEYIVFDVRKDAPTIEKVSEVLEFIAPDTVVKAIVSGEDVTSVFLNIKTTDQFGESSRMTVLMKKENGEYSAQIPNIKEGHCAQIWVNAYNSYGNSVESAKQQGIVLGANSIAISSVEKDAVTVCCDKTTLQGTLFLASYNKDVLINVKALPLINSSTTFTKMDIGDSLKVFLWDNESIEPQTTSYELHIIK